MRRKVTLAQGETYHIYNRGAHKNVVFTNAEDYKRFLLLLHLSNSSESILMRDIITKYRGRGSADTDIFLEEKPDKSLVDILAYCLMPNHFHLVLRQKAEAGITKFMNRVGVAYSMYFNTKYRHSGVLFQGRFQSKHIDSEAYFRYIFAYIHLNPIDLFEPGWEQKRAGDVDLARLTNKVKDYAYSSFGDYHTAERPEGAILALNEAPDFLKTQNDLNDLLVWHTEGKTLRV